MATHVENIDDKIITFYITFSRVIIDYKCTSINTNLVNIYKLNKFLNEDITHLINLCIHHFSHM